MTSNINVNNIITTFPIPGQDNDSQGFRDNFTNIKISLTNAKSEIEELQGKALLKNPLTGTALTNNMAGSSINSALIYDFRETQIDYGTASGTIILDHSRAHYHSVNTNGNITLGFNKLPPAGTVGRLRLKVHVNSTSHTILLPSQVITGLEHLVGYNPTTRKIYFARTGVCLFEFLTDDNGTTFNIQDLTRGNAPVLEPASRNVLGFVQIGNGLSITTEGLLDANALAIADDTNLGGIIVGDGLLVEANGYVSVNRDFGTITNGDFNARIGDITPNAGTFTTVVVNNSLTLGNVENSADTNFTINSRENLSYAELVLNTIAVQQLIAISNNSNADRWGIPTGAVGFAVDTDVPLVFAQNSTERMRFDANGIGIGTTMPGANLHIDEGSIRITGMNMDPSIQIGTTDANGYSIIQNTMSGNLTINYDAPVGTPLNTLVAITTEGNFGIGNADPMSRLVVNGNVNIIDGNLTFTKDGIFDTTIGFDGSGVNFNDGVSINGSLFATGNIGFGTITPSSKFEIYNAGNVAARISANTTGYSSQVEFNRGSEKTSYIGPSSTDVFAIGVGESIPIAFYGNNKTEYARIDVSGNVNIGNLSGIGGGTRSLELMNANTYPNSSVAVRLTTSDNANVNTSSLTITKNKSGIVSINNSETAAAARINLQVGTTGNVSIDSAGNLTSYGNLIAVESVLDSLGNLRDIPVFQASSTAYVLTSMDAGTMVSLTSSGANVTSGEFMIGQTVTIFNSSSSSQTITEGAGVTMFLVGSALTGDRTLAQKGLATLICVDTETFVIAGGGLS